jgi:hypothetical protein
MPLHDTSALEPSDVAVFSGDDDLADTVRPRLESAGADLSRVRPILPEVGIAELRALRPALIILDPLSAYCEACEEARRKVIGTLNRLATETGAAVLAIQAVSPHPPTSDWPAEVRAAVRSILSISAIDHRTRRLTVAKSNLRPSPEVPPLVYHHTDDHGVVRILNWSGGL